jgi:hypothetical protein
MQVSKRVGLAVEGFPISVPPRANSGASTLKAKTHLGARCAIVMRCPSLLSASCA